ncbi:MAG: PPC domain-containing protein [Blastocatellia bacterium]|nr:PPC domain-containing protein [Blastocatellia bacterium]
MKVSIFKFLLIVAVALAGVASAVAQSKRINVKFAKGATSGTYSNAVMGYGSADFYVNAKGGQQMSAKLTSSNKSLYFLIIRDPANPEAIADDARDATNWSGELPEDGTYIVRVFLFRNEARRNKSPVRFSLRIGVK